MSMTISDLFLSCCVAIGFVTATSLVLANNVGKSLYARRSYRHHGDGDRVKDRYYKYRGNRVERKRWAVRWYSGMSFAVYLSMVLLFAALIYLFDVDAQWAMVAFSAIYIACILWSMGWFCLALFSAVSDDESATPKGSRHR